MPVVEAALLGSAVQLQQVMADSVVEAGLVPNRLLRQARGVVVQRILEPMDYLEQGLLPQLGEQAVQILAVVLAAVGITAGTVVLEVVV